MLPKAAVFLHPIKTVFSFSTMNNVLNTQSLRYQINLRIFLSIAVLLLFGGSQAIWQARHSVSEEVQSSLNLALQLIASGGAQAHDTQNPAWLARITSLKATRHLHIEMQDALGHSVYFKGGKQRDDSSSSPPSWFVNAVTADYPQAEYRLLAANGKAEKIIIRANPLDEITEAWEETRSFFVSITLMMAVVFLAVNLVFNKALKSVAVILGSIRDIENGHYLKRLPTFSTQEFNIIANAINHLMQELDKAHRENNALALHSLEIQEEERQRLAKELHDEFGQSLTAIKVMTATIKKPTADKEKISESIVSICDHLFGVLRSMMRTLHPMTLDELGLRASLDDLADQWRTRYPELLLTVRCEAALDSLEHKKAIQLFRIIQECLTNVVRHAHARHVTVELSQIQDLQTPELSAVRLSVKDDGRGCDLLNITKGFGLLGIRERIKSLGGHLSLHSLPQQGLTVEASIPCGSETMKLNY